MIFYIMIFLIIYYHTKCRKPQNIKIVLYLNNGVLDDVINLLLFIVVLK